MRIIAKLILRTLAVVVAAYILPGVFVDGYVTALVVAVVLGILNSLVKPILIFFTLPLTILTLGLFTFVINALLVLTASSIVRGFSVDSFVTALIFSFVLALVNYFLDSLTK